MSAAAHITSEILPGLLCTFRTASNKSWGGGLGMRLGGGGGGGGISERLRYMSM